MVAWARGGLARSEGRLVEAERRYRAVLAIQPDFLPGRLELGRVSFEDRKDREASALFRAIRTDLAAAVETAAGVRATVDTFIAALDRRRGGQGRDRDRPRLQQQPQPDLRQPDLPAGGRGRHLPDRPDPAARDRGGRDQRRG